MAEGWARHLSQGRWEVGSAGTSPARAVSPYAVAVMREAGVDISGQYPKGIDPDEAAKADLVVTLCGDARDRCPVTPPHVKRLHWPIEDPIHARGSEEEILSVFRRVRDEIRKRVEGLLQEHPGV